jgi:hypothetical protein
MIKIKIKNKEIDKNNAFLVDIFLFSFFLFSFLFNAFALCFFLFFSVFGGETSRTFSFLRDFSFLKIVSTFFIPPPKI